MAVDKPGIIGFGQRPDNSGDGARLGRYTARMSMPATRTVFSVSRLNREVKGLLEGSLPLLWVEGEISNLARPASGHIYFSLKDEAAQVRCAMFRSRRQLLRFMPENGQRVLLRARATLYEARGDYQLVVEHMEEAGDGLLQRRFEELKARLQAEGLFDGERKRPLPTLPRAVGVVTSASGAALHDILTVLGRRFPALPVFIYPTQVQGAGAAEQIVAAIDSASRHGKCDALIVGRGGGSLEDLQAFNDERVARAIAACPIPVVSAVGHEVDFSIADFVADARAATPSAAAELLSPPGGEWLARFSQLEQRLAGTMQRRLQRSGERLLALSRRLRHPGRRLQERGQRLDELERRLQRAMESRLQRAEQRLQHQFQRLQQHTPQHRLERLHERLATLPLRLQRAMQQRLQASGRRLAAAGATLEAVSPLATLRRGYAIVSLADSGELLREAHQATPGDTVEARLGRGRLLCHVNEVIDETP